MFIAQAEKTFREHRDDPAFDFGPVIVGLGTALERQTNATLAAALRSGVPVDARRVNIDGKTVDLLGFRALTLGELARILGGERQLATALAGVLENAGWFTGSFPVMLDALAEVRNAAAHGKERIDRKRATEWRDRILGVGSIGEIVELAKVRVKASAASGGTVRSRP